MTQFYCEILWTVKFKFKKITTELVLKFMGFYNLTNENIFNYEVDRLLVYFWNSYRTTFLFKHLEWHIIGNKIIRALAIILAVFVCFDCQFLSSHACYEKYEAKSWLDKYSFHKTALGDSFSSWIISSAGKILLPTVQQFNTRKNSRIV